MNTLLTNEEVFDDLKKIIIDKTGFEEIEKENNFYDDLNLDSLDMMEILVECETEFSISINDDEFGKVETVSDLVDLVVSILQKK